MNFFQRINWYFFIFFVLCGLLFFITPIRDGIGRGIFFIVRPILLFGAHGTGRLNSFGIYFKWLGSVAAGLAVFI